MQYKNNLRSTIHRQLFLSNFIEKKKKNKKDVKALGCFYGYKYLRRHLLYTCLVILLTDKLNVFKRNTKPCSSRCN